MPCLPDLLCREQVVWKKGNYQLAHEKMPDHRQDISSAGLWFLNVLNYSERDFKPLFNPSAWLTAGSWGFTIILDSGVSPVLTFSETEIPWPWRWSNSALFLLLDWFQNSSSLFCSFKPMTSCPAHSREQFVSFCSAADLSIWRLLPCLPSRLNISKFFSRVFWK